MGARHVRKRSGISPDAVLYFTNQVGTGAGVTLGRTKS